VTKRQISEVRTSHPSQDGDGVAIQRVSLMGDAGTDPVLLIDELRARDPDDLGGGFPPHPHRGMQTLTYLRCGGLLHEDSLGNRGEVRDGGVQWLSAGSGVIHSEMPVADSGGLHGFQLWFNLPAEDKMAPPRYRDVAAGDLARRETDGWVALVIAGTWALDGEPLEGPLSELVPQGSILDLNLGSNIDFSVPLAPDETAMAYVYDGSIRRQRETVPAGTLAIATGGDEWVITAGAAGARALVIVGRPIGEPVAHYGPFVMNTVEEIEQTLNELRHGGFIRDPDGISTGGGK